jgi:uncharacterized protein (TIGR03435 family)
MTELLVNHLWQSSSFAAIAGLVALALKNNPAQVRYWVWMVASIKFLIPFAVLVAIGNQFGWRTTILPIEVPFALDVMPQTFSQPVARSFAAISAPSPSIAAAVPSVLLAIWLCGCIAILLLWLDRWLCAAAAVRLASAVQGGRELAALRHLERLAGIRRPITLVLSEAFEEPTVFGIRKCTLVWPRGISDRLSGDHIRAIVCHEVAHVRRHDNLTALLHMVVEAVFWFHPLVWWIGSRLVDERERACDEHVTRFGNEPRVYAESILRTCEFCVESRLACVSGVTGSNLTKRIESIMTRTVDGKTKLSTKIVLASAGVLVIVVPIIVGASHAAPRELQTLTGSRQQVAFEAASIKPNKSNPDIYRMQVQPGGRLVVTNAPLRSMIRNAYRLQDFQIVGGPEWVDTDRFDVVATAAGDPTQQEMTLMLRALLAERFQLRVHDETRELAIYGLTLGRSDGTLGPQIGKASFDCASFRTSTTPAPPASRGPNEFNCGIRMAPGSLTGRGSSMTALAMNLSIWVNRVVLDRTGLTGDFDLDLHWTPDQLPPGFPPPGIVMPPVDPNGPSIFTALQEQLGLKLESARGPVEVLVIDHAERPTPD